MSEISLEPYLTGIQIDLNKLEIFLMRPSFIVCIAILIWTRAQDRKTESIDYFNGKLTINFRCSIKCNFFEYFSGNRTITSERIYINSSLPSDSPGSFRKSETVSIKFYQHEIAKSTNN